jgi:hypothetical protein
MIKNKNYGAFFRHSFDVAGFDAPEKQSQSDADDGVK